jgi:hypothetical protein
MIELLSSGCHDPKGAFRIFDLIFGSRRSDDKIRYIIFIFDKFLL